VFLPVGEAILQRILASYLDSISIQLQKKPNNNTLNVTSVSVPEKPKLAREE
jgi:hypothetical protein